MLQHTGPKNLRLLIIGATTLVVYNTASNIQSIKYVTVV